MLPLFQPIIKYQINANGSLMALRFIKCQIMCINLSLLLQIGLLLIKTSNIWLQLIKFIDYQQLVILVPLHQKLTFKILGLEFTHLKIGSLLLWKQLLVHKFSLIRLIICKKSIIWQQLAMIVIVQAQEYLFHKS